MKKKTRLPKVQTYTVPIGQNANGVITGVIQMTKKGILRGYAQHHRSGVVRVFQPVEDQVFITADEVQRIYRTMTRMKQDAEPAFRLRCGYPTYLTQTDFNIGCWRIPRLVAQMVFLLYLNEFINPKM